MTTILFVNNAQTTLAGAISDIATTLTVAAGGGDLFPAPGADEYFVLTLSSPAASSLVNEIVHVTQRNGDVLTVVRAQEGTTARAWAAASLASSFWTAGQASALQEATADKQPLNANLTSLSGLTLAANKMLYATGPNALALTDQTALARVLNANATASDMRSTLDLVIGADVQAFNANLQSIAALTLSADKLIYATGAGSVALTDFTSFGRSLIGAANQSSAQSTLGLVIGTNVQAQNANLQAISGLTLAANKIIYATGPGAVAQTDLTAFARTLLDDGDQAAMQTTLGLVPGANVQVYSAQLGGVSLSQAYTIATRALALTLQVPAATNSLRTGGYYTAGDGGGALYVRGTGPYTDGSSFQSADGAWWLLAERAFTVEMFGAKGDGSDDATAINNAIQFCIGQNGTTLQFLHAVYSIASPLLCFSWSAGAFAFFSLTLKGRSAPYITSKSTSIVLTYVDRPALIIQAARNICVENLAFIGGANNGAQPSYTNLLNDGGATPWWNTGAARDQPFSPYAGIAIDPFCNGVPTDGGYPGLSSYYTANTGTSGVFLTNVKCAGFIVGVTVSTSGGGTQLGDNMVFNRCSLGGCKVSVAVGQSQDRGVMIRDPFVLGCQAFIDTKRYGAGTGGCPTIEGGIIDFVKWLMNVTTGNYQNGCLRSIFCESIYSLGFFSGNFPLDIEQCFFKFLTAAGAGTAAADNHLTAQGAVNVRGGVWSQYDNTARCLSIANNVGGGFRVRFDGVTFDNTPIFNDASNSIDVVGCKFRYTNGSYGMSDNFVGSFATIASRTQTAMLTQGGKLTEGANNSRRVWTDQEGPVSNFIEIAAITITSPGVATFTPANAGFYRAGMAVQVITNAFTPWNGNNPSDLTISSINTQIGYVTGISGGVVTIGEVPLSVANGSYQLGTFQYLPLRQRTVATTASGSPNLTGVNPTNSFAVGDRIRGAGIPEGAYVNANDFAGNITLSVNATATATVPVYSARVQMNGLAAAAPTTGVWFQGDYMKNTAPTVDGNSNMLAGWEVTATGSPGTWTSDYRKTTSP